VLSIRLTDEEKVFMGEMMRTTQKSVSTIMREAMFHYTTFMDGTASR
jgi:predicted transcriptional regulator